MQIHKERQCPAKKDDMKTSSYKKFKDYDFADAKPAAAIPALRKLHAESAKERVRLESAKAAIVHVRAAC